ncbi:carbohydrate-binding family 9-like protein [Daejeonella sp. H1SJ63]|jgi:hypothetical protein|uniref:carbohydrate-binding family 9-like protein n=1 Tax=Daejeonella sp. H1SJ63 TaxID=3034145 RepID=UPI0023EDA5FA|nr:carbohydrate-binding family 9-like protein [Daejeonella sp. H1SJ63]
MNFISYLLLISLPVFFTGGEPKAPAVSKHVNNVKPADAIYKVSRLKKAMPVDANWDKPQWKKVKTIKIEKYMGAIPPFKPQVEAKMMYDQDNVYVIFRVKDRFVKSVVQEYNGNVSGDSCVEFFFAPDTELPLKYFNLEINAGGTPLIYYVSKPWTEFAKLKNDEIKQIEIAHSLPSKVDPEITEPVTWTLEYRLPLAMLKTYSNVTQPAPGVIWKANFYKTGSRTSNPNYLTWNFVDNPKPNFHLPQFFGTLIFK